MANDTAPITAAHDAIGVEGEGDPHRIGAGGVELFGDEVVDHDGEAAGGRVADVYAGAGADVLGEGDSSDVGHRGIIRDSRMTVFDRFTC